MPELKPSLFPPLSVHLLTEWDGSAMFVCVLGGTREGGGVHAHRICTPSCFYIMRSYLLVTNAISRASFVSSFILFLK
jgi:hypothetical protein